MKMLFLAPLPPPVTGHSLASEALLEAVSASNGVDVINLSEDSSHDGTLTIARALTVLKSSFRVWQHQARAELVYLTISESLAGNLKDLLFYVACWRRLDRVVVHLHGGSIKRLLFDRHPAIARINAFFLRRVGAVVILGPSHQEIFAGMVDPGRLHLVPNFAPDDLFVDADQLDAKFAAQSPLRVLYVSGMDKAKGYADLVDAYRALSPEAQTRVQIDFGGRFPNEKEKALFLEAIAQFPQLRYHGIVSGTLKRDLFTRAHLFCLPTTMLEGQPISILEAYAAGCVVLATGQPGILDIFSSGTNGYQIGKNDPASIARAIETSLQEPTQLATMARGNMKLAEARYRRHGYAAAMIEIFERVASAARGSSRTAQDN